MEVSVSVDQTRYFPIAAIQLIRTNEPGNLLADTETSEASV